MCNDDQITTQIAQEILDEDRKMIKYRPSWKDMTGSITSAILLQQIRFRWKREKGPFYKFIKPPTSEKAMKKYKKGDSWCEELGFTGYEYEGAFKLIGKRLKKDDLLDLDAALDGYFVGCIQTKTYETIFYFNEAYFNKRIVEHYKQLVESESDDYPKSFGKKPNGNNPIGKKPNGFNPNAIQTGKSQTESVSEKAKRMISKNTKDNQRVVDTQQTDYRNLLADSVAGICAYDIDAIGSRKRDDIRNTVLYLEKQNATPEQVEAFLSWFVSGRKDGKRFAWPQVVQEDWLKFIGESSATGDSPTRPHERRAIPREALVKLAKEHQQAVAAAGGA